MSNKVNFYSFGRVRQDVGVPQFPLLRQLLWDGIYDGVLTVWNSKKWHKKVGKRWGSKTGGAMGNVART